MVLSLSPPCGPGSLPGSNLFSRFLYKGNPGTKPPDPSHPSVIRVFLCCRLAPYPLCFPLISSLMRLNMMECYSICYAGRHNRRVQLNLTAAVPCMLVLHIHTRTCAQMHARTYMHTHTRTHTHTHTQVYVDIHTHAMHTPTQTGTHSAMLAHSCEEMLIDRITKTRSHSRSDGSCSALIRLSPIFSLPLSLHLSRSLALSLYHSLLQPPTSTWFSWHLSYPRRLSHVGLPISHGGEREREDVVVQPLWVIILQMKGFLYQEGRRRGWAMQ